MYLIILIASFLALAHADTFNAFVIKYHLETSVHRLRPKQPRPSLPAEFVSERLQYRLETRDDKIKTVELLNHPRVLWHVGSFQPPSTYLRQRQKWALLPYAILHNGAHIGGLIITRRTPADLRLVTDQTAWLEIGYVIDPSYWGFGYATEATRALIKMLREHIEPDAFFASVKMSNQASVRVLTKNDFVRIDEGRPHCHFALSYRPDFQPFLKRWQRYTRRQRLLLTSPVF